MQALSCQCYYTLELGAFFQLRFWNNKFGNGAAQLHGGTAKHGTWTSGSPKKMGGDKLQW